MTRHLRNDSTFSEILLWLKIKGKALGYEFHRQVPRDEYIVDFYCHERRLIIIRHHDVPLAPLEGGIHPAVNSHLLFINLILLDLFGNRQEKPYF